MIPSLFTPAVNIGSLSLLPCVDVISGHSVKLFDTTAEHKDDLAIGRLNVMVRANEFYVLGAVLVFTAVLLIMPRVTLSETIIPKPPSVLTLPECRFGVVHVAIDYSVYCTV